MIFARSVVFLVFFALESAAISLLCVPALFMSWRAASFVGRLWSRVTFWGLRVIAGTRLEIRGAVPRGGVLVAAKHMSMADTIALYLTLHDPAMVLRSTLLRIPFYGWYVKAAGSIVIDRDGGAATLRRMTKQARAVIGDGRQVVIFPEGTRKKPDTPPDYKPGVAGIYGLLGVPCVPVALNTGVFWTSFAKYPGRLVVEFLEPIPPGLGRADFMQSLQGRIESATRDLVAEGRAMRNH